MKLSLFINFLCLKTSIWQNFWVFQMSQWVVLEYELSLYFRHSYWKKEVVVLSLHPVTVIWLLLLINLTYFLLFSEYTIHRNGRRVSHQELYCTIKHFVKGYLTFAFRSQSFCNLRVDTIIEKVELGTSGHEGRALGPPACCLGHLAFSN